MAELRPILLSASRLSAVFWFLVQFLLPALEHHYESLIAVFPTRKIVSHLPIFLCSILSMG
ncbi:MULTISPECIES: hypothetical protein [unclassified Neptuniibacter]|uniref:hypothetical protein n=1 Tax=unclassified Neptuniibacter TaxID=2630693 RepID=UPI0025F269F2|nr:MULTISPECIES: hypothetical protein [unclassified Neptuniibacter]